MEGSLNFKATLPHYQVPSFFAAFSKEEHNLWCTCGLYVIIVIPLFSLLFYVENIRSLIYVLYCLDSHGTIGIVVSAVSEKDTAKTILHGDGLPCASTRQRADGESSDSEQTLPCALDGKLLASATVRSHGRKRAYTVFSCVTERTRKHGLPCVNLRHTAKFETSNDVKFKICTNIQILKRAALPWYAFVVCLARAARQRFSVCRVPGNGYTADRPPLPCSFGLGPSAV
jgi:hypothetical protein